MERDETADALQSDLEHREAALGRALSLLKPLWMRAPTDERCFAAPPTLSPASSWPDVRRWIADEPREDDEPNTHYDRVSGLWTHLHWLSTHKRTVRGRWVFNHTRSEYAKTPDWSENMDDDETPQVMEVANPAERAAAGVDESLARWRGHSDEELSKLMFGLIEAESEDPRPGSDTLRAELTQEIATVLKRREGETPSYRGPGRYRTIFYEGDMRGELEVLGRFGERVIVSGGPGGVLGSITWQDFNRRDPDGRCHFAYAGPLRPEGYVAKAEIERVISDSELGDQDTVQVRDVRSWLRAKLLED